MSEWLWRDEGAALGLRVVEGDNGVHLEIHVGDAGHTMLDAEAALELAEVLRVWAMPAPEGLETPDGVSFQVYYRHELFDDEGALVPCRALGNADDDGAYTWDETDLVAVRERVRQVGRAVADLYEATTGQDWSPDVEESAHAWISVFRMPDDVRVWKGFWNDLDEVGDDDLLE